MAQAQPIAPSRRGLTLTRQIFIGLAVGILAGAAVEAYHPAWAIYFRPFSLLFLRLIKMVIAPLIFSTLVAGIAGAGHFKVVGRMGLRALIYFECVTTLALVIGLVAVNLMKPGIGVKLPMGQQSDITAHAADLGSDPAPRRARLRHRRDGAGRRPPDRRLQHALRHRARDDRREGPPGRRTGARRSPRRCSSSPNIVMHYAPIGVAAAIAYTVGHGGMAVLYNLAWLVVTLYLALAVLILGVFLPIALIFKIPMRKFIRAVKEPAIIAFSTTSSEAALPRAMEAMERLGVPRRIVVLRPAARLQLQPRRDDAVSLAGRRYSSPRPRASISRSASRSRCC